MATSGLTSRRRNKLRIALVERPIPCCQSVICNSGLTPISCSFSRTVQTLLRHSDAKLTLQFYTHAVSQDRMAAAGEMLAAILSHAADQSGLRKNPAGLGLSLILNHIPMLDE